VCTPQDMKRNKFLSRRAQIKGGWPPRLKFVRRRIVFACLRSGSVASCLCDAKNLWVACIFLQKFLPSRSVY
jgi:hypothetical protein